MRKYFIFPLLALAACQHPKVGGAAQPTTFVDTKSVSKVTSKLTELCSRAGLAIEETSNNSVTCGMATDSLVQFVVGTKGGSDVQARMRMTAFPAGNQIKVVANGWYESQSYYGRIDRVPATDANSCAQMQSLLDQAKLEIDGKARR